jgi:hypothetical protein
MREMLAPGVWSENVPSSAIARPGTYRTLGGSIVTARKAPSLGIVTNGELIRHRRQHEKRALTRIGVCEHPMTLWRNQFMAAVPTGELCQRRQGHKTEHRSAYAMENAAAARRKRR